MSIIRGKGKVFLGYSKPQSWRNRVVLAGQIDTELIVSEDKDAMTNMMVKNQEFMSTRSTEFILSVKNLKLTKALMFLIRLRVPPEELAECQIHKGSYVRVTGMLYTHGEDPYVEAYELKVISKEQYQDYS